MALCLTFGGTPCPFEWGVISKASCDLATAFILHNDWNPDNLHAPNQENFPPPIFLPNNIPFKEGKELIVNVSINERGTQDIYINDLIGLGLDLPKCNNKKHLEAGPLLVIDVCLQPATCDQQQANPLPQHGRPPQTLHGRQAGGNKNDPGMDVEFLAANYFPPH
jgi:hypothetical protein